MKPLAMTSPTPSMSDDGGEAKCCPLLCFPSEEFGWAFCHDTETLHLHVSPQVWPLKWLPCAPWAVTLFFCQGSLQIRNYGKQYISFKTSDRAEVI